MQSQHRHRRAQELRPLFLAQQVLPRALRLRVQRPDALHHRMTTRPLRRAPCIRPNCGQHKNLVRYRDVLRRREP